jgi:hypothetical protein
MDRLFCSGGSATLSVTDNNREMRGDMENILALHRITRLVATSFCLERDGKPGSSTGSCTSVWLVSMIALATVLVVALSRSLRRRASRVSLYDADSSIRSRSTRMRHGPNADARRIETTHLLRPHVGRSYDFRSLARAESSQVAAVIPMPVGQAFRPYHPSSTSASHSVQTRGHARRAHG